MLRPVAPGLRCLLARLLLALLSLIGLLTCPLLRIWLTLLALLLALLTGAGLLPLWRALVALLPAALLALRVLLALGSLLLTPLTRLRLILRSAGS